VNKLTLKGFSAKLISTPNYESLSSGPARLYLDGKLSKDVGDINAYAASSFFAIDRFIGYMQDWESFYEKENSILVCDRYVTSNMIYQLAKIDRRCYNEFLEWLFEYEHKKLGVPEPDLVFYLQVPIEISQSLLDSRYDGDSTKRDLHESDKDYLFQCEIAAQYASKRYKWKVINCSQDGLKIDEISDISKKIWKHFIKEVVHK
jgi:dTMP kinase